MISVTSTALREGEAIPRRFTCDGRELSPPLRWHGVPKAAGALALVVDDPDAPHGSFVHWLLLDLPVATSGLDAGSVPSDAVRARNSAGGTSYVGPCPPSGTHHYRFTVYALSRRTGLRDGTGLARALQAVRATATARGRLVATYARRG